MGAFENQIHDFNPGIASNGVFWTIPMPDSAVDVAPGAGRASYRARNLPMPDYHDFVSSIYPATSEPAVVSFDIRWSEIQERTNRRNTTDDFAGEFVVTKATAEWSSRQAGFEFQSDPGDTSVSEHAIVGHERNGVFF